MNSLNCLVVDARTVDCAPEALLRENFPTLNFSSAMSMHEALEFTERCIRDQQNAILIVFTIPYCQEINEASVDPVPDLRFTERQRQLIDLLLIGKSNKVIADALNLSYGTVKNYIFNLMRMLSVTSRLELVARVRASSYQSGAAVQPIRRSGQLGPAPEKK